MDGGCPGIRWNSGFNLKKTMVMTPENVKKKIKVKFGSVSAFLKVMSWTEYELQKAMKYPETLYRTVARTEAQPNSGLLDVKKLNALQGKIKAIGGAYAFWLENRHFPYPTICQILQGRRKRMTPKVQALFDHFGI